PRTSRAFSRRKQCRTLSGSAMKFVSIYTYDPDTMPDTPDMAKYAEMGALIEEMRAAGVLLDTGGTSPTGVSMRVRRTGSDVTATDGPFTETKELIGGFAILNVDSKAEALTH